jgi:hypothetical protein
MREYGDAPLWTATSDSFDRDLDGKIILKCILKKQGQDNTVIVETRYGLDGPGIEFRQEDEVCAPVQTSRGAHPVSCTMDTGSLSPGGKRLEVALTAHPV